MNDEELIFRTMIAGKMCAFDPFKVERLLAVAFKGEPLKELLASAESPVDEIANPAHVTLLKGSREAFGLQEVKLDGSGGVNEVVQMRVLTEFLMWRHAVKKNIKPPSTTSAATAAATSGGPSPMKSSTQPGC